MASKLSKVSAPELEELEMDMSPMIDMVFLLLIFFMVNSTMIINRLDPNVTIPVGDYSKPPEVAAGRVVVNIYNDGKFYNDEENEMVDMAAITDYVEQKRRIHKQDGTKTRLLIRGDLGCKVEKVKHAVKAAADAGVIDVIFSSYQKAP